ncbi:uncharacterized protein CXQ87_003979 [Candidozyma duobushaemuli]|uniref:Anaphase-promoting complex subunit 5 n=1 Tax=Candidozyma duobushaemuli TaxID=1231522 RepID=A0A2V1AEH9_9ASCO|nr:uncharacterized protein CXQ87_003979 [[Candida] duobushaemulonis]PVH16115.1 hypothetical protein CXQ87_003979 [[Candida] duobushaemulonis]
MLDFGDIASQLQNPSTPRRIVPVLRYISRESQKETVSSLEKNQLIHISKNLTRSSSGFDAWCGVNILGALSLDKNFCVQKGAEVLDLLCNTVGKNVTDRKLLRSCLRCIERVLGAFWLDPSHSRDLLTQRLPILIGLCSTALSKDPGKEEPQKHWSAYLASILHEMVLTFSIFENFMNIGEMEYMRAMFENFSISERLELFPPLQIEASSSSSLMQIFERFHKLISILEVTLASPTSDSVQIPVGLIMKITEGILSVNVASCHFKAHFRGDKAKDDVLQNLLEVQISLLNVIRSLEARLKGFVVPYSHRLLELYEHQARCLRRYKSDHNVAHLDSTVLIEAAGALMCLYLNDGDYHASFDALHQYFDYVVSEGSKEFYHFALIAKASLHVVFGEEQDALRTIEEAGNIAREHKDEVALTFVLTWLYKASDKWASLRSSKKTLKQRDSKLLELLVVKDLEQQSLLNANVLQLEYENILLCGASQKKCFQAMSKSLYCWLNCNSKSLGKVSRIASRHWLRSGYPTLAEVYLRVSEISLGREASQFNDETALSACEIFFWKGEDEKVLKLITSFSDPSSSSRKFNEELSIWKIIYMIKMQLKTGEFVTAKELLNLIDASSSSSAIKREVSRLNVQLLSSCDNKREALRLLQSWAKSSSSGQESPSDLISSYLIKSELLLQANLLGASFVLILEQMTRAAKHGLYCLNIELAVRINLPHATSEPFKLAVSGIEPSAEIPSNNVRISTNEESGKMEMLHQGKRAMKSGVKGLRKTRIPQGSITASTNL